MRVKTKEQFKPEKDAAYIIVRNPNESNRKIILVAPPKYSTVIMIVTVNRPPRRGREKLKKF